MKESFKNRALENLEAAELLFDNEKYNASANRAYYAAFHIAIAALFSIGLKPTIDHRSVQALFVDMFINKRKIISSDFKKYLYDLQNVRNTADYKDGASKKIVSKQLKKSKQFEETITKVIL